MNTNTKKIDTLTIEEISGDFEYIAKIFTDSNEETCNLIRYIVAPRNGQLRSSGKTITAYNEDIEALRAGASVWIETGSVKKSFTAALKATG